MCVESQFDTKPKLSTVERKKKSNRARNLDVVRKGAIFVLYLNFVQPEPVFRIS